MVDPDAAAYQPFMRMKLSVIICCYNEIATIQDVIARKQSIWAMAGRGKLSW